MDPDSRFATRAPIQDVCPTSTCSRRSAYEQGQTVGGLVRWALLLAAAVALGRRITRGRYGRGLSSQVGTFAGLAVVLGLLGYSVYYDVLRDGSTAPAASGGSTDAYIAKARTDMVAGCVNAGSSRAYCGCVTEHTITGLGSNVQRMEALDAEVSRMTAGSEPPAILTQSMQACASLR